MPVWKSHSLISKLTIWYGLSSFFLTMGTAGILYFSLRRTVAHQDHQIILEKVRTVGLLLDKSSSEDAQVKERIREWSERKYERIYIRANDDYGHKILESGPTKIFEGVSISPKTKSEMIIDGDRIYRVEQERVSASNSPGGFLNIQVALDRTASEKMLERYREELMAIAGIAFVICVFIGRTLALKGVQPVMDISRTASVINSSNLSERIKSETLPVEFSNLASTFNGMLDRLEEHLNRLSRFSADIAHELRTPVNNLIGEFGVTLSKSRAPEEYREVLASGIEECDRIAKIIDVLLFVARAENPETTISKENFDLGTELLALKEFYEAYALEEGISIEVRIDENILVTANKALLHRAIGNLLSNSIAHTPKGGLIAISAEKNSREIKISVRDTGIGIEEKHLSKIFDRFYRSDESRSKNSGGTGLGLSIFKSIISLHGGSVSIASQIGQGTVVSFVIPSQHV